MDFENSNGEKIAPDNIIELKNISFSYKQQKALVPAISNLSFTVARHSFVSILGPSGSGKSTLLKILAGFLRPQTGSINIGGTVSLIFQDYALFPHKTVEENINYGLALKKRVPGISRKEQKIANKALLRQCCSALGISDLRARYPSQLSGGQQQRVALARALVLKTDVLLMDEPLSSLDEKLRLKLRDELKVLQKSLNLTIVYVTHDRDEALSLSDKIILINDGALMQIGTKTELYFNSKNRFTASFIGNANFIKRADGRVICVRPEWIAASDENSENTFDATVTSRAFYGSYVRFGVKAILEGILQALFIDIPSINPIASAVIGQKLLLTIKKSFVIEGE